MLIAAFIFVISLAVVTQFAALSWRAALIRVAAEPLQDAAEASLIATPKSMIPEGFAKIAAYSKLCPDLAAGSTRRLSAVSLYFRALEFLKSLGQMNWTAQEMTLCTRYAAVTLSHRLQRNQATLAAMRSF
jgi:hypothetical protein